MVLTMALRQFNKAGSVIINCQFEQVNSFKENITAVKINNKWDL